MNDSLWSRRIANAERYYQSWHSLFKCDTLEDYYQGFQWKGKKESLTNQYRPYQINLFYSTIKIKLASLLFQKPSYMVSPRPGNSQWDLDFAVNSAQLKQDTLNTIIQNPNTNFVNHVKLAALDSFFRFGLLEVGYAADWRNPQKEIPYLKSWDDENVQGKQDRVIEDNEVPVNERFFVKRINPRRFRISLSEATDLQDHEWCGYYEYYYTQELQKTKGINWPKNAPDSDSFGADYNSGVLGDSTTVGSDFLKFRNGSVSKVWHLFDMVAHKRLLLLDGSFETPLWENEQERLPLIDQRWDFRLEGFYPIPPAFQWISPQDEINEAREQTRSYRRRFTRKFQYVAGTIKEEEAEKFATGPDGVLIKVERENAISPIQNPEQGPTAEHALILAKEDFNIISGTSAEARGSSDRETATAARIIDARSQIRESAEQMDFSVFLCRTGREILACAAEKLAEGMWIKYSTNPSEGPLMDMQVNAPYFAYIKAQDLSDGYDFDIEVDIRNSTPAAMEQQKQAFLTFVALVQQSPMLATSPTLIREAAYRLGYRNERVIREMQQAVIASIAAKQQMAMEQQAMDVAASGNASNANATQVAQEQSPDLEAIQQQISQQVQ